MFPAAVARARRVPPHAWPCLAALVFVLAMVAARYDRGTGLTELLRFGDQLQGHRIPQLAGLSLHEFEGVGYDGQYYAQLAVDPGIANPAVHGAMDFPRYRPRRILLSAVVHVATGFGRDAWLTLHAYALSNLAVWIALGWLLWRRLGPAGWRGTAVWLACMLNLGALDSIRMGLTDLPAMLLVVLAIMAVERGRRKSGSLAVAAALLTRDTSALTVGLAVDPGDRAPGRKWRALARLALIGAPLALWAAYVVWRVPEGSVTGVSDHFAWPGLGIVHHLHVCVQAMLSGDLDPRYVFGFLTVFSLGLQAWIVFRAVLHRGWEASPWLRAALPYTVFLALIGDAVWKGYWAVVRTNLPLTFAFNLHLLETQGRRFWWMLAAANLSALHGIYRMLPHW